MTVSVLAGFAGEWDVRSCLVLGHRADGSAVHLLWGFEEPAGQAMLITVYLPDPQRWTEDFRKRRARDAGEAE